jgi:hypothetical protein
MLMNFDALFDTILARMACNEIETIKFSDVYSQMVRIYRNTGHNKEFAQHVKSRIETIENVTHRNCMQDICSYIIRN